MHCMTVPRDSSVDVKKLMLLHTNRE